MEKEEEGKLAMLLVIIVVAIVVIAITIVRIIVLTSLLLLFSSLSSSSSCVIDVTIVEPLAVNRLKSTFFPLLGKPSLTFQILSIKISSPVGQKRKNSD